MDYETITFDKAVELYNKSSQAELQQPSFITSDSMRTDKGTVWVLSSDNGISILAIVLADETVLFDIDLYVEDQKVMDYGQARMAYLLHQKAAGLEMSKIRGPILDCSSVDDICWTLADQNDDIVAMVYFDGNITTQEDIDKETAAQEAAEKETSC